ncbi:MAG: NAD(P)/FAD-dependent oxidoreductase [Thermomicrobiales bacterium]
MSVRVIVVGGGIVGAATAYRLATGGATVTLLEADRLGGGTTTASFAWLNANDKPPFAYHLLNVSGMHEYHRLPDELGTSAWLHLTGNTEWDASAGGEQRLRDHIARLRSWGYPAELLPIAELAVIEPDLVAPDSVESFAFYPSEGYVDPVQAVGCFSGAARAAGAEIRPRTRVQSVVRVGNRVTGVVTGRGECVEADVVVSCTGRWSNELARLAGIELPMAPTVGMVVVTAPAAVRPRAVHHDEGTDIRPDGAGRVMMRHTDFDARVQPGQPVADAICQELLARVVQRLPGLAGVPIETARVAYRAIPGDEYSVVGPAPGVEGLYLVVTHSAVTLGPLLGRLVAQEILADEVDERLAPFRPERLVAPAFA